MTTPSIPERRQRHAVRLDVTVARSGGGEPTAATVTDLSLDGCCLSGHFQIGEQLIVKIPRIGALTAHVRWAFMGRAGVRFVSSSERAA